MTSDVWASAAAYEPYVGRWSRVVAAELLTWLDVAGGSRWLDVGCGTGAAADSVLRFGQPAEIIGVDQSEAYVEYAGDQIRDPRARFMTGSATELPFEDGRFDAAISGLMLNFVSDPRGAVAEMSRVTRPDGTVAAYVWDYAGEMQLMRHFWNAATELYPDAAALDEGTRFPLCRPEPLRALFADAGLRDLQVRAIDVPTTFRDFDDYWTPFLGGQGPAPGYAMSLTEDRRAALRERLRAALPHDADGSIRLVARAWAARGRVPDS